MLTWLKPSASAAKSYRLSDDPSPAALAHGPAPGRLAEAQVNLFVLSALATFCYVFLRAFQQLNVTGGHYWRVPAASILMGVGDVILILLIVKADTLWIGVTNGLGGMAGCWLAMYLDHRLGKRV